MPVFLFALLFAPVPAEAQRWGVRLGVATEGQPLIGGEMIVRLGSGLFFNPNIELGSDLFAANADAYYQIDLTRTAAIWAGGGIALVTPEEQDLDVGVNLLAGMGSRWGPRTITYVQGKIVAPSSYDNYVSLAIGIRF